MPPPLPRCSRWAYSSLKITHPCQPSPIPLSCRPAHRPFRDLLGVHSRCGLHTRAVTVFRDRYPGASDISSPPCLPRLLPAGAVAGWALHPLEKRRLVTAHVDCGPPPGPARATSLRRFRTFSPLPRNGKGSTPRRHSQARFALPTAPRARPARIDGCVIGKIACIYLASCSQKLSA